MPAERLPMCKTREVLRLKWALGLTARQVAGSVGLARSTMGEYLRRAEAAGHSWEEVERNTHRLKFEGGLGTTRSAGPSGSRPLPSGTPSPASSLNLSSDPTDPTCGTQERPIPGICAQRRHPGGAQGLTAESDHLLGPLWADLAGRLTPIPSFLSAGVEAVLQGLSGR